MMHPANIQEFNRLAIAYEVRYRRWTFFCASPLLLLSMALAGFGQDVVSLWVSAPITLITASYMLVQWQLSIRALRGIW